ncbi:craniofacial development protein 1-like [Portunus trituberculatus]|uniref:Craniofacial development protein 1 n=1 Tax=Portunus trituberculatus TaxID=210409 RepID=A0A5B7ETF1_PORTR|nr:craniofacial development protein 1-like [Portunus trituberculatus]MPC36173.1 Craniofacial development protein 1 [Portunus trituberculatus]
MLQDDDYDSDTSDEDFVPEGVVESDDEAVSDGDEEEEEAGEGDEGTTQKGKKKKQRKKGKQKKKSSNGVEKEEEDEQKEIGTEESKKKDDSIWADFLADVEDKPSPPPKPKTSSWGALLGNKKPTTTTTTNSIPAKAPAPVKKEKQDSSKPEKVKITQVFEFAGEEVRVEKEVDAESVEAQAAKCSVALTSQSSGTTKAQPGVGGIKRGAGLSGLVSILDSKKQKLTTLEKTKLDWNSFKSEEGIDEELEKHKKSKDGYLDKQAFLERADLRQFEIERAMRMSKRSNR